MLELKAAGRCRNKHPSSFKERAVNEGGEVLKVKPDLRGQRSPQTSQSLALFFCSSGHVW